MAWLDKIPLVPLLIAAVLLGGAPFTPEPHLVEKTRWLLTGELRQPVDIFDFFMHGGPLLLVILKLARKVLG